MLRAPVPGACGWRLGHRGDAGVWVNGKKPAGVRQGAFLDTDGTETMVLWIELESTGPTAFKISGAKPAAGTR